MYFAREQKVTSSGAVVVSSENSRKLHQTCAVRKMNSQVNADILLFILGREIEDRTGTYLEMSLVKEEHNQSQAVSNEFLFTSSQGTEETCARTCACL